MRGKRAERAGETDAQRGTLKPRLGVAPSVGGVHGGLEQKHE